MILQAVVIEGPGQAVVKDVADPTPAGGQVVVRVHACGLCGTDLHLVDGVLPTDYPLTPGHEFAGEVVELGEGVTGLAIGDRVAVDPNLPCGTCRWCRAGRGNLCQVWDAIGVSRSGAAAELVAVPADICFALPSTVSYTAAAMVEPLSCAVHGVSRLPRLPGSHYLIYGAGTMGLMMMELAKRAGAASVDMVDLNPTRLETARELGCSATVTSADELDRPRGWEIVVDCTGVVAAIEDGLGRVAPGGTFQQFGVANEDAKASFSPYRIYNKEIRIVGSMAVLHSFERAAELFAEGALRPDVMISHRMGLDEYPAALEQFRKGVGRKIQVMPHK